MTPAFVFALVFAFLFGVIVGELWMWFAGWRPAGKLREQLAKRELQMAVLQRTAVRIVYSPTDTAAYRCAVILANVLKITRACPAQSITIEALLVLHADEAVRGWEAAAARGRAEAPTTSTETPQ